MAKIKIIITQTQKEIADFAKLKSFVEIADRVESGPNPQVFPTDYPATAEEFFHNYFNNIVINELSIVTSHLERIVLEKKLSDNIIANKILLKGKVATTVEN